MRFRVNFGIFAPSLAQLWTTFKYDSDKENDIGLPVFLPQCGKWDSNWDGRGAKSLIRNPKTEKYIDQEEYSRTLSMKRSKASRNIILIRHGQYEDMAKSDDLRHLTEKGRLQAHATGRRLKELRLAGLMPFTVVVNSNLRRAMETADLMFEELADKTLAPLPRQMDPLLREGAPCPPEPKVDHWHPEGQYLEDGARIEAAFRHYFHRAPPEQEKDSYEVLVCHGNVIRYFVCRALQFPPQGWLRMSVAHASITWICIRPEGRVGLRCLGDVGHLPPELVTFR